MVWDLRLLTLLSPSVNPLTNRKRLWPILAFGVICVAAVLNRMPAMAEPFGRDTGVFTCVAAWAMDGAVPYRDIWDNKPPLLYVVYALAFWLFGPVPAGIYVVATVCAVLTMMVIAKIGTEVMGRWGGMVAAGLFGVFGGAPRLWGLGSGAVAETFMLLPIAGAVFLWVRSSPKRFLWRSLASGALCGIAFWLKATGVLTAAVLVVGYVWQRPRGMTAVRPAASFLAGFVGVALVVFVTVCALGIHDAFCEQVFVDNFMRSGLDGPLPKTIVRGARAFTYEMRYIGAYVFLAGVGLCTVIRRGGAQWYAIIAWAATGWIAYCLGSRFYPHYLVEALPALALLSAKGVCWLATGWRGLMVRGASVRLAVAAGAVVLCAGNAYYVCRSHYVLNWRTLTGALPRKHYLLATSSGIGERLSAWLNRELDESDTLFVWGHVADVYVYTGQEEMPAEVRSLLDADYVHCGNVGTAQVLRLEERS